MRPYIWLLLIPMALSAQVANGVRGVPAAPPPTPVADLATVEGQVFNALDGSPLRKASIVMNRSSGGPTAAGAVTHYSATSDASGHFSFGGIEPGTYRVSATHIAFLGIEYNAHRPGGYGTPIELGRAQKMTGVDFHLTPHGVISGKIADEDGDPLQSVQMQLLHVNYVPGGSHLVQVSNAATDDLGEFRLAGITPGKYYLRATYRDPAAVAPGRGGTLTGPRARPLEEDYVPTYVPGVTDSSAASPIVLAPGEQMPGLNLRLTKIHTVRVSGRVENTTRVPPPGGRGPAIPNPQLLVHLQSRNALDPGVLTAAVQTGGVFELSGVAPGAYTLMAVTGAHSARQSLDVGNSNIEGLNLVLNPGVTATGHVHVDGDAPLPPGYLAVQIVPREDLPGVFHQPAKVDAEANFRFDDVDPMLYSVTMVPPPGYYLKSIRAANTDALVSGLDLRNGAGTLDILLGTNPPQVAGSVLNSDTQRPAPGVTVVLVPQEKERQSQTFFYLTATTDRNGNFNFTHGLMQGEYKVYAWEDVPTNAWYDPEFMKEFDGKGESVSAREGSPVNLKLTMIPAR
jgi:hypothetical protein